MTVLSRVPMNRWRSAVSLLALVAVVMLTTAAGGDQTAVEIGWLSQAVKRTMPLSYLDQPPGDEGNQGARLGIADDNTTGHFTGQSFDLVESVIPEDGDVAGGFRDLAAKGIRLVVTDLAAPTLLSVARLPAAAAARSCRRRNRCPPSP